MATIFPRRDLDKDNIENRLTWGVKKPAARPGYSERRRNRRCLCLRLVTNANGSARLVQQFPGAQPPSLRKTGLQRLLNLRQQLFFI
ncbi:hypothetical protein [Rhodoferax ferrireducens]|uniref:hypothetical protein n=1 Tax=Rhodoferax ferrireducens TaxID=192843 RepID=UPI00286A91A1|nr:hypothetical protein [Rhodoferax ferrireducens]